MCAVVCDAELTIGSVICAIIELVAKSLVNVEFDGPVTKYRLSESPREYALEKLQAEGEKQDITSRSARYLSSCFQTRSGETIRRGADISPDIRLTLHDARSAFDWAFTPDGDPLLGVELTSNLVGALLDCGMIEECCMRTALASALPHVRGLASESAELWQDVWDRLKVRKFAHVKD